MSKIKIYVLRHGESIHNRKKVLQGHLDAPLSDRGLQQAEELAQILLADIAKENLYINTIYSSDLQRALQTAQKSYILLTEHGYNLDLIPQKAFREIDIGDWEGKTIDELKKEKEADGASLFEKWLEDPINHIPPRSEPMSDFFNRIVNGFTNAAESQQNLWADKNSAFMIFAHGGSLSMILNYVNSRKPGDLTRYLFPNASGFSLQYDYLAFTNFTFQENFQFETIRDPFIIR